MTIPKGKEALYSGSSIVEVEVKKCCDWLGFSYTDNGWHYLSATIKEFIANPNIKYNKSLLSNYYRSFQPKSIQDCFFYKGDEFPSVSSKLTRLPWGTTVNMKPKNNQHFGPNSDTFVENEFRRTKRIYNKIASEGYQPEKYRDGYIRGHFFKNDNDYRFMLASGQHRMAVLGVLGYQTIQVKIHPNWKRVIDKEDLLSWPYVHRGTYDKESACKIFNAYFTNTGREKAQKLNLLN